MREERQKKKHKMGYLLPDGYMGWVESEHRYLMFATEDEYLEVEHKEEEEKV